MSSYSDGFCVKFSEAKKNVAVIIELEDEMNREWNLGTVCVKRTREHKYLGRHSPERK